MTGLRELTEQLATAVRAADPTDARALADLRSRLRMVAGAAAATAGVPRDDLTKVRRAAEDAESLLGCLTFEDSCDVDSALRAASIALARLQRLVEQIAGPWAPGSVSQQEAGLLPAALQPVEKELNDHSMAVAMESAIPADDLPLVHDFVTEARGHMDTAEGEILKLEEEPGDSAAVDALFRSFHTIKGVAGFLKLKEIGALAHDVENLLDLVRSSRLQLSQVVFDLVLEATDEMNLLLNALDMAARCGGPIARQPSLSNLLERLGRFIAEAGRENQEQAPQPASESTHARTDPNSRSAQLGAAGDGAAVRVATNRLDSLMDVVGELVIAQAVVGQDVRPLADRNHRLARSLSHLGKVTRELQGLSMSLRMVPVQSVFRKMARLARDLACSSKKEIKFVTVGGETELDRNLIEAISDPLVHMVRNAIDHGVEPPDVREQAGKPRAAHLQLTARHHAGSVVIEIADDGRGLDTRRIRSKAVDAGLVGEGQELSEQETFRLIFHPGLSTAEQVTDVSGRGVGMDVVRKNVEALRGRIDITSAEGKGSAFTVRLPLTLAVIDGLVARVGSHRYVIPITGIEHSIRPKAGQLSTVQERGELCLVRGRLLPLFRLHKLFRLITAIEDPTEAIVVVLEDDGRRCCVMVDELLGQQQILIKPLGGGIAAVAGVSGAAVLGDGSVNLVLDVPGLIDLACAEASGSRSGRTEAVQP